MVLIIVLVISQKSLMSIKRYSTIEKETLNLMLALNHFDVCLNPTVVPISYCFHQQNEGQEPMPVALEFEPTTE